MRNIAKFEIILVLIGLAWAGIVACSSASREQATPTGATVAETLAGPTRITDATVLSTHVWKQPTSIIQVNETPATATPAAGAADPALIERGKGLYEKKECNTCHGDNAEGIADKGSKLAGIEMTEEEFEDTLRTGGRGRLGNEHLYGTSAITSQGIQAIYAYLQSLGK
jgi:cytochrome c5